MIEVSNLSKHYGSTQALSDVSFSVEENKVTGFLGPNGAGKSTAMRLMLGLDHGQGSVLYDGKQLSEYSNPASVVGILLEMKAFHPTRTARNHLRVLAAASGVPDKRVDEALEIVGLSEVANKKPGNFSLGMSQRLGLAAAILTEPKYLLLDEPANGLDPEGMAWLRKFMKNYATDGKAVLVSSHMLGEMSQMADNLVVIGRGQLITAAPMDELLKENASVTFVRTEQPKELEALLKKQKIKFQKEANGYTVHDKSSDEVGKLAHKHQLLLLELTPKTISLEDVFLRITSKAQQFKATEQEQSKMINTLKSEFKKIITVKAAYIVALIGVGLAGLISVINILQLDVTGTVSANAIQDTLFAGMSIAAQIAAIFAIILMGHEYRYNIIFHTLLTNHSKLKILASKVITSVVYSLVVGLIVLAVTYIGSTIALEAIIDSPLTQTIDWLNTALVSLLYVASYTLIGLLLTLLFRTIVAPIVILILVPSTIEPLLGLVLEHNSKYLPFTSLQSLVTPALESDLLTSTLTIGAYLVVGWYFGWQLFTKRDAAQQ